MDSKKLREIEEQVLGSMLVSEHAMAEALDCLRSRDFQSGAHRSIFGAIKGIASRGIPVGMVEVGAWIKENHPEAPDVDGKLAEMMVLGLQGEPFLRHRCGSLIEATEIRKLDGSLREATGRLGQIVAGNGTLSDIVDEVSAAVYDVRSGDGSTDKGGSISIQDAMTDYFREMREQAEYQDPPGLRTGIPALDEIWGGLRPGEMTVIGGMTGLGKSLFAQNLVAHAATRTWEHLDDRRANVMMVSTEMSRSNVVQRFLAIRSGVDMTRLRDGRLDEDERRAVARAAEDFQDAPISMEDTKKPKLGRICRMAKNEKRLGRLDFLVIDLLTHIRPDQKIDSRELQVAEVSQELAGLALELNIPVMVTVQLNRNVLMRADKKPNKDDLRYSAAPAHDSAITGLLWRDPEWPAGRVDLVTDKNRNGPQGNVSMMRVPRMAKYEPMGLDHAGVV